MISSFLYENKKYFSQYFAQSIIGLPCSNQPMDFWIELTMNLDSKIKQGWLQLLQNDTRLFHTTRDVNNVARTKKTLKNSLNCYCCHQKHVEFQPARMKKDEQAVQDLILCMDNFNPDPFDESAPELHLVQCGVFTSYEVLKDLRNVLEEGENQSKNILEKVFFVKNCL